MIIRSVFMCAIILTVKSEGISVHRHFRGDIFNKEGELNDYKDSIAFRSLCPRQINSVSGLIE